MKKIYLLDLFYRRKWNQVSNFSFDKRNGERYDCAVSIYLPVPLDVVPSCASFDKADVELQQAMQNFCQQLEQYINWGIDQCEQKIARKMKRVLNMCTITERVMARIARRNNP